MISCETEDCVNIKFVMLSTAVIMYRSVGGDLWKAFAYLCYFVVFNVLHMGNDGSVVRGLCK